LADQPRTFIKVVLNVKTQRLRVFVVSLATIILLAFVAVLLLDFDRAKMENVNTAIARGAKQQLREIYITVAAEFQQQRQDEVPKSLEQALQNISRRVVPVGRDFFKLLTGTNHVSVCLNPEVELWARPGSHSNLVAGYWPLNLSPMTNRTSTYISITYDAQLHESTNIPAWSPVDAAQPR
jgi:hypothetical protein